MFKIVLLLKVNCKRLNQAYAKGRRAQPVKRFAASITASGHCRTIVLKIALNRSGTPAGSLERFHPLEKCDLTSEWCPSPERLGETLGTTVQHFLLAQARD